MGQRIFTGRYDQNFFNPANWTPNGLPQSGDTAGIVMAAAVAGGTLPAGVMIGLSTFAGNGRYASLTLQSATVPAGTTISATTMFSTYDGSFPSSLGFAGAVVNDGVLILGGGVQPVTLPSGTTLTNDGTIDIAGASPQFITAAGVSIVNNGLIRVINPADQSGQNAVFGPAIGGAGTITVSLDAGLEFGAAVGSGQALHFVGGANAASTVTLDQPAQFAATISGFVSGDMLTLAMTSSTSLSYIATGAAAGTLLVYDGGSTPVARCNSQVIMAQTISAPRRPGPRW